MRIRFFNLVEKTKGCWEWLGAKNKSGYGRFRCDDKKLHYSHRVSFEFENGNIPIGLIVCHSCDNPSCVNPKHLFLGTHKDNTRDMILKNRMNIEKRKSNRFKVIFKGSSHPCSKLTEELVKEIKIKLANGIKGTVIAREYNVSDELIYGIKKGISWKHVVI